MLGQILLAFFLLGWWESANPFVRRSFDDSEVRRQTTNVLLLVTNYGFLYIVGLLFLWRLTSLQVHLLFDLSSSSVLWAVPLGVMLLDLGSYLRHRLMHWRWLWLVHRVHHSDEQMNWTTEFRFHPIEALVTLIVQSCVVLLFGIPPAALALYALISLAVGCWQHANVIQPAWLDRVLGWFLVTPSLHRVHHQIDALMLGTNFGVVFPWWDQIMGTYAKTNAGRQFGVLGLGDLDVHSWWQLLVLPLRRIKERHE